MTQHHPIPHVKAAAAAIAADLIPATQLAVNATVHGARALATMLEQSAELRQSDAGAALPIQFADEQISLARRAFDAAYQAFDLFKQTRVSAIGLQQALGYGAECFCFGAEGAEAARLAQAA